MPYRFLPNRIYRMPTHFGPATGPRQGENGRRFACIDSPKSSAYMVSFLTRAEKLDALLPEGFGFRLDGEPVVTITAEYNKEIEWLAGRGYNTLGMTFPVAFDGQQDHVKGSFLTVLWENKADPIITGRDELGFSKIYCEIPEPLTFNGETRIVASWDGFKFFDMRFKDPVEFAPEELAAMANVDEGDGTLHFKYIPRTGEWGKADVAYPVLTPAGGANTVLKGLWRGKGSVEFHPARWEDMPTQFSIVNVLAGLEIIEYRDAMMFTAVGAKDLSDQRILR